MTPPPFDGTALRDLRALGFDRGDGALVLLCDRALRGHRPSWDRARAIWRDLHDPHAPSPLHPTPRPEAA